MTANRCPKCGGRLKPENIEKNVPKHRQQVQSYKCKKCGRRWIKVNRSWRPG